eukprot:s4523_g2.t1
MNVDNEAWDRVHPFLSFGFNSAGQSLVASVGYVAVNAALLSKMKIRHLVGSRHMLVSGQSETARSREPGRYTDQALEGPQEAPNQ